MGAVLAETNRNEDRTAWIDLLRGLASISVAVFHFNEAYPPQPDLYHRLVKFGWLGVPVFFVISGYCVAQAREGAGRIPFFTRRLLRIYPPYWASLLLVMLIAAARLWINGVNDVPHLPRDLASTLFSLFAVYSPGSPVVAPNWSYWSLGYELAFYLLLGLAAGARSWLLPAVTAVGLLLPVFPLDQWALFAAGVVVWLCQAGHRRNAVVLGIPVAVALVMLSSIPEVIAAVSTAAIIALAPGFPGSPIAQSLRRTGDWSYSLYLIHVPIGCFLLARVAPDPPHLMFATALVRDAALLAACLGTAAIFYRLIEAPSHRLARRLGRAHVR